MFKMKQQKQYMIKQLQKKTELTGYFYNYTKQICYQLNILTNSNRLSSDELQLQTRSVHIHIKTCKEIVGYETDNIKRGQMRQNRKNSLVIVT